MRSPIKWFGGKSRLAERIIARIPPHVCYVEVFGGAGWVLFRKNPSKSEIYNDLNDDLVNLFAVLRDHLPEFTAKAQFLLPNRTEFYRARNESREHLDPIERALRFYTLVQHSFNTNLVQYKPKTTRKPVAVDLELLQAASRRLQKVWLEHQDFEKLIRAYDDPTTFFYLDPPYAPPAFARVYGWPDHEHDRLKRVLSTVKGRFLISYPDWPRFRTLWQDHYVEQLPTRYSSLARTSNQRFVNELLISNYDTAKVAPNARPGFIETVVNPHEL